MRNIDAYPITFAEMIDACERAAADATESYGRGGIVGDIQAAALQEAAKRLKRLEFAGSLAPGYTPPRTRTPALGATLMENDK